MKYKAICQDCGHIWIDNGVIRKECTRCSCSNVYWNYIEEQEQESDAPERQHPLLNPESTHYQMIDGVESIERLEQMYTQEEMAIWAKITAMKYRMRIGNKDDAQKEATKIKGYEEYYKYLMENNI